jgi:hypothetical protein
MPTLNHAGVIARALQTVHAGLAQHFPRARTVVIAADGGSKDGTLEIVGSLATIEPGGATGGLRTRHQVGAAYRGAPGRSSAIRLIFTAADLLRARTVALVDPDAAGLTPAWVGTLAGPVMTQSFDFVAPLYGRHPLEALLATQLMRPLMRAAYGRQIEEPLLGEFGCSGRFATHCLTADAWDRSPIREGIEPWLAATALAGEFKTAEAVLGPRKLSPDAPRPGLTEVFGPLVGSLFATLDSQAGAWLPRTRSEPLPVIGRAGQPAEVDQPPAPSGVSETFGRDVRDLRPVLEGILAPDTLEGITAIAETSSAESMVYPDEMWVATVYDFVGSYHHGVMGRAHIVQALMPLYMGRVAAFVREHSGATAADIEHALELLARQFEERKPYLIERWHRQT